VDYGMKTHHKHLDTVYKPFSLPTNSARKTSTRYNLQVTARNPKIR